MDQTAVERIVSDQLKPLKDTIDQLEGDRDRALSRAERAESRANDVLKSTKKVTSFTRKTQIMQEKYKYKTAGEKRAVGYLVEEKFDLSDIKAQLLRIVPENAGGNFIRKDNVDEVEQVLDNILKMVNMRSRKNIKEIDSYSVANSSRGGWKTEKKFRGDEVFSAAEEVEDVEWWEKEELTKEEKEEKLRKAERDVKWEKTMFNSFKSKGGEREGFQSGVNSRRKFTRWGDKQKSYPGSSNSSYNQYPAFPAYPGPHQNVGGQFYPPAVASPSSFKSYVPQQSPGQPAGPKLCFVCQQPGHISRFCPKKPQN